MICNESKDGDFQTWPCKGGPRYPLGFAHGSAFCALPLRASLINWALIFFFPKLPPRFLDPSEGVSWNPGLGFQEFQVSSAEQSPEVLSFFSSISCSKTHVSLQSCSPFRPPTGSILLHRPFLLQKELPRDNPSGVTLWPRTLTLSLTLWPAIQSFITVLGAHFLRQELR